MYFTVELCCFVQAMYINRDPQMHCRETDTPARCRSTNLCQEIGQVSYVTPATHPPTHPPTLQGFLFGSLIKSLACCMDGVGCVQGFLIWDCESPVCMHG
jgi:hypothetical protein